MSTSLFITPPHPLHHLPFLIPPPNPLPPTYTTRDFLLSFPPHAATVLRSHHSLISRHQRYFHIRRLVRSAEAVGGVGAALDVAEAGRRVDAVCDGLLDMVGRTVPVGVVHELIITIVCVNVLRSSSSSLSSSDSSGGPVETCFVAYARFTSPFPSHAPLVSCLLHPTAERYLATHKHSQWIRDRTPLEALKQRYDCGELIMCEVSHGDDGGDGGDGGVQAQVREGLITNVLVEDGGVLTGCRRAGRLLGYFESLLVGDGEGDGGGDGGGSEKEGAVTAEGLRAGRYDSVFITGTSVCIAAVSEVKWLAGGGGQAGGQRQYSEASIRRVEVMRQRMLATLDRHLAEDKQWQLTNGMTTQRGAQTVSEGVSTHREYRCE